MVVIELFFPIDTAGNGDRPASFYLVIDWQRFAVGQDYILFGVFQCAIPAAVFSQPAEGEAVREFPDIDQESDWAN